MKMANNRIILFDDEAVFALSLSANLKLLGWNVKVISDIPLLFSELNNNHFDAIIMDIMVPIPKSVNKHISFTDDEIGLMNGGLNTGLVLTIKIWSMQKYKNTPVLFLSGKQLSENFVPSHQFIGKQYLFVKKPELSQIIDEKLRELLSN